LRLGVNMAFDSAVGPAAAGQSEQPF